ncbi:MAG TPA: hypothetical protein VHB51_03945 [Candidatus Saccharimonadales bacterium]|nr:hypothetical protein [Candidatus Saccharimonadales bacterium]
MPKRKELADVILIDRKAQLAEMAILAELQLGEQLPIPVQPRHLYDRIDLQIMAEVFSLLPYGESPLSDRKD